MEEQEMVKLLKENPQKGIEKIMEQYSGLVFCIIRNKVSGVCSGQDIEECASDVFFAIYRQRESIDLTKARLQTYICLIAKRKAISLYQKVLRKNNVIPLDEAVENTYSEDTLLLDERYIHKENRKQLLGYIEQLQAIDRQIILRKYFFRQSSKEIGELLDMSVNAVDLRVHRALQKLRTQIQDKGL